MSRPQEEAEVANAMSVSELTGHIKAVIEGTFPSLWVLGEISDLSRPRSGHIYLTLKDDDAQIRGVIWRSTAMRLRDMKLRDGQEVLCQGNLDVYAARGGYQLIIRKIQPQGLGALQAAFQRLQEKLYAEGLFSAERKRPLPRFPRSIAVITSPSGAAVRDFLKAATNRWQGTEIVVIPTLVQGAGAAKSVVGALKSAHRITPRPDIVVLTRGGGSLEDLWTFNEEPVVRAVAASKIPVVSAVGHEVDVTLCDLAADLRALTPTDGATRALPDANAIESTSTDLRHRLDRAIRGTVDARRSRLESLAERSVLRKPHDMIHLRSRVLDDLDARARRAMSSKMKLGEARVAQAAASLSALSPLEVLTRGYSVTLDSEGQAIRDAADVTEGDVMSTRLRKGSVESIVRRVNPGKTSDGLVNNLTKQNRRHRR